MTGLVRATLPTLVAHNVRIAWRMRARGRALTWFTVAALAAYALVGVGIAVAERATPIGPTPMALTIIVLGALVLFSFATSQALSLAEHALYGSGDLDLLLTAPLPARIVLWSKLIGIAATVLMSDALFILPVLAPLIVLGHPALAGALVLLIAVVMVATCVALAVLLAVVRLAGPRAARSVAQIMVALSGGAFVLASQTLQFDETGTRRNGFVLLYGWARAHALGQGGWSGVLGRSGFGDPLAVGLVLLGAVAVFAATGVVFERRFLTVFQQSGDRGGARVAQSRAGDSAMPARFTPSLLRTMLTKEVALLRRNPQLIATLLLRLVYLAPLMLVIFHGQGTVVPALAFAGVFVTTQLAGELAWLVISGEDTPDLLAVAPVARADIGRAKTMAAMLIAAPMLGLVSLGLLVRAPVLVPLVVPLGLAGSWIAARIQLALARPAPRKTFGRRMNGATRGANLLVLLTAMALGAIAAMLGWWLAVR